MIDETKTDDEQAEALKRWLSEYGKSIAIGILLAVSILFGWQGYQKKVQGEAEAASAVFQSMLLASQQQGDAALASVAGFAETLKNDYPGSIYAQMAALHMAKSAAEQGDNTQAQAHIQWVLDNKPDKSIQALAELRMARLLLAEKQYAELNQLADNAEEPYLGAFAELKGDALTQQGKQQEAVAAYQQAIELNIKQDLVQNNRSIETKLQSLGVNTES